jgi:hypothetical protein
MQESLDRAVDADETRLVSEALTNLYAAHANSLLYPYNHPLISDPLKNAFQCLQYAFRKRRRIRIETDKGRLIVGGEVPDSDFLLPGDLACWLNCRKIKALSFTDELTLRELISFHRIISMKKLTVEELSKAMSEKGVNSISVHPLELSVIDAGASPPDDTANQVMVKDYVSTMYHTEGNQLQSPFFNPPAGASPPDDAANQVMVKDYVSTMYHTEGSDGVSQPRADSLKDVNEHVTNGNAVLHDIELPGDTAGLINKPHLTQFRDNGASDVLTSAVPASTGDADHRKNPRYLVADLGVSAKTIFNNEVEILDMGIGGASIRSTRRLIMGYEYTFKFELNERVISIEGIIVWERLTGNKKIAEGAAMLVYMAGVEFRDVFTAKAEELKDILADKLKERRLSGVRIKLHAPEKAVLSYFEPCVIKVISLSGIRIEAEQEPSMGAVFPLEVILPKSENPIHCAGRVAFCHEISEKTPQKYAIGVEFSDMIDEDKLRLKRFIEIPQMNIREK